jgi:Cys-tRNA(Pro) deacylase
MIHPSTQKVIDAAIALGIEIEVVTHAEPTRTAQEAAEAVGCAVDQIIKSLCFMVDNKPVMVLVSGKNRLDEKKLAGLLNVGRGKVKRPNADEVKAATGYSIGGVNPLGLTTEMPILIDEDLMRFDAIWTAAGTPNTVFEINSRALVIATNGTVVDVKKDA